jgi:hypothetical protein
LIDEESDNLMTQQVIIRDKLKAYDIGQLLFRLQMLIHGINEPINPDLVGSQGFYVNARRHYDDLTNSLDSFDLGIPSFDEFQQDHLAASRRVHSNFLSRYPDLNDFVRFGINVAIIIISLDLSDTSIVDQEICDICARNGVSLAVIKGLLQRRHEIDLSALHDAFDQICNNMANQNDNTANHRVIHTVNYIENNNGFVQINMSEDLTSVAAQIQSSINCLQKKGKSPEDAEKEVAQDIVTQAQNDPTAKEKLIEWSQSIGTATVTDVAKGAVKLAIRLAGIPIP